MNIEPLFAYCIIEREKLKSSVKSPDGIGFVIPDDAAKRNAHTNGILAKAGDRCEDFIKSAVGKKVIFKQHAGNWMKLGAEEVFFAHEDDILAVVQD